MHRLRRLSTAAWIAVAGLPLVAAACSNPFASSDLERARDRLADARREWALVGVDSYEYTVGLWCFCGDTGPVRVRVLDGVVVSRVYVPSGDPVPGDRFANVDTVEELFDYVEAALDQRPEEVELGFGFRGVPMEAWFDYSRNVADEEGGFGVSEFAVIDS